MPLRKLHKLPECEIRGKGMVVEKNGGGFGGGGEFTHHVCQHRLRGCGRLLQRRGMLREVAM